MDRDKSLLLAAIARRRDRVLLTSQGIRDRLGSIRTCKHPQRQRELLYRLVEDIAERINEIEKANDLRVTMLTEEHRAECAELERRHNEQIRAIERRFVCDECNPKPCTCHAKLGR